MLTLNQVAEVAGVTAQHVRNWIAEGVIVPTAPGGMGRGNTHRFSVTCAVGIAVAVQLQQATRGCVPSYFAKVVAAFSSLTEDELRRKLDRQGRNFVDVYGGKPHFQSTDVFEWPDVEAAYEAVAAKVREPDLIT